MSTHNVWTHKGTFLLAAVGSAVGLGNLWRLPYLAGENGGGAFLLVYVLTLIVVGTPILISEILLGRSSRRSPIMGMRFLTQTHSASRSWEAIGWLGSAAAFIVLSFYSVVAGWTLHYTGLMLTGAMLDADAALVASHFDKLMAAPILLTLYHGLFIIVSGLVVGLGVHRGIENALRFIMPALFAVLLTLLGYGILHGNFQAATHFLLHVQFDKLSLEGWLTAMGQSFFTLSLGVGALMAYGAYMSSELSLTRTAIAVVVIDTAVSLVAGLAIFTLVFGAGLNPAEGPGLMFISLPLAFSEMQGGALIGAAFFLLVFGAALSSAISLIEPTAAYLLERFDIPRPAAVALIVLASGSLGLVSVLSFNLWSGQGAFYQIFGRSPFEALELLANILMPLGGVLIALFAGWSLTTSELQKELATNPHWFRIWRFLVRFVSPFAVAFIFLRALPYTGGYVLPLAGATSIVGGAAAWRMLKPPTSVAP